jgi:hypothetical protein
MEKIANNFPGNDYQDEFDPMLKDQFDIAARATRIQNTYLVEAARAVVVGGERVANVAERLGLESPHIYRAIGTIEKKWADICAKREWSYLPIALPARIMKIVLEVQAEELEEYRREQETKRKKKKT